MFQLPQMLAGRSERSCCCHNNLIGPYQLTYDMPRVEDVVIVKFLQAK